MTTEGTGTGAGATSETGADTSGSSTGTQMEPSCDELVEIAADKLVTLTVTNNGASPRYVVTGGFLCPSLELARVTGDGDEPLLNNTYDACPCECPGAAPYPSELVAVEPGASVDIEWDGRYEARCTFTVECYEEPLQTGNDVKFARQPVEPGSYRVSVSYFDTLPDVCGGGPEEYSCSSSDGLYGSAACGADARASAEVMIADGDVAADVLLP